MGRRCCQRIPERLDVKFFVGNSLCSGIATNLSERGMCINTDMYVPCGANIKLLVVSKEKILNVMVTVKRLKLLMTDSFCNTMGVAVLNPHREYLEFVDHLRITNKFNTTIKITEETLKQTTKCHSSFQCLTENRDICLVDRRINGRGLVIRERNDKNQGCQYLMSFGFSSYICNCPTRYELYTQYNI